MATPSIRSVVEPIREALMVQVREIRHQRRRADRLAAKLVYRSHEVGKLRAENRKLQRALYELTARVGYPARYIMGASSPEHAAELAARTQHRRHWCSCPQDTYHVGTRGTCPTPGCHFHEGHPLEPVPAGRVPRGGPPTPHWDAALVDAYSAARMEEESQRIQRLVAHRPMGHGEDCPWCAGQGPGAIGSVL